MYTLRLAVLATGLTAAGAAIAQQAQYPLPAVQQTISGAPMGQMGPMSRQTTPMMSDPRIQAQMTEMMRGCHRMMTEMQAMYPGNAGRR